MKKLACWMLLAALLTAALAGCSPSAAPQETPAPAESVATPAPTANPAPAEEAPATFVPGVYQGTAEGMKGPITVEIFVDETHILDINVLAQTESERLFSYANPAVPRSIIRHQSLAVDTVAGATMSSRGLIGAVQNALEQAGADISLFQKAPEKAPLVSAADESYDVVIVGAGASGLSAAIELGKTEGVRVLVLEKLPFTGGSFALSGGLFWTGNGSKYVTKPSFTPDSLLEWFEMRSETASNGPLVKHIANVAGETFDYLMDNGAPWNPDSMFETYPNSGIFRFETNRGATLTKFRDDAAGNQGAEFLRNFAQKGGAEIRVNAKVTSLVTNGNAVTGVTVEDGEKAYTVHAQKVILATGGFGYNPALLKEFDPDSATKWPFLSAGSTGDGIEMTRDLGVTIVGNGVMSYEALTPNMGYKGNIGSLVWVPELIVNKEGKRFVDETGQSTDIALRTYLQTDDISFGIDDSEGNERIEDYEAGVAAGLIYKADTLEDLAAQLGVDSVGLLATVETYNATVANGTPDEFGSVHAAMKPVTTAPYYAVPIRACIIGTMPGLLVSENCEVLGADNQPIANLFAAGELMFGNVFNRVYPATGTAVACAIYTGRIAAETAANQID